MKSPSNYSTDVIVVGAGVAGLAVALALAKKTRLQIRIFESASNLSVWNPSEYDLRVSAYSLASQRILQRLGVWESMMAARTSPYQEMLVWDESGKAELNFNAADICTKQLGWIIEDNLVRHSLLEEINKQHNITIQTSIKLIALDRDTRSMTLKSETESWQASLVLAADGANSWMRQAAGISSKEKPYYQKAIVATVETQHPHQATAYQRFLKSGPLAFLPLQHPNQSSIVWSAEDALAETLMALDDTAFKQALADNFTWLGDVTQASCRKAFPLMLRSADHYVQDRLALLGDAAHTIHPLAGQGVNLGLLDVACLVDVIAHALDKGREYGSVTTLRRYERERKTENATMLTFVDNIQKLFAHQNGSINYLTEKGVQLTNQYSLIKNFFSSSAVGNYQRSTLAKP